MIYNVLAEKIGGSKVMAIAALLGFLLSWLLLKANFSFLPKDQGREFAVNGALSKGKTRGVGLVMFFPLIISAVLFMNLTVELIIYGFLLFLEMLSGYLDDGSKIPWSDYKKGLIDFIVAVGTSVTFVYFNSTDILLFNNQISIHPVVYVILASILVWLSINATNCSDGVDGLCSSVSVVTLAGILLVYRSYLSSDDMIADLILIGVLIGYLIFNSSPSSMLMGDAGSRLIGLFIAMMMMKSQHPFGYILVAIVLIVDGIAGLIKIFLKRFFKISVLKNTRTPIHDEMRKNRGWSDTQVVNRFTIIQIVAVAILFVIES